MLTRSEVYAIARRHRGDAVVGARSFNLRDRVEDGYIACMLLQILQFPHGTHVQMSGFTLTGGLDLPTVVACLVAVWNTTTIVLDAHYSLSAFADLLCRYLNRHQYHINKLHLQYDAAGPPPAAFVALTNCRYIRRTYLVYRPMTTNPVDGRDTDGLIRLHELSLHFTAASMVWGISWLNAPHNLHHLALKFTGCTDLKPFIYLGPAPYHVSVIDCQLRVFPVRFSQETSPRKLYLSGCPKLCFLGETMQSIEDLTVEQCPVLSDLPQLPHLRKLRVSRCTLIGWDRVPAYPQLTSLELNWAGVCLVRRFIVPSLTALHLNSIILRNLPNLRNTALKSLSLLRLPDLQPFQHPLPLSLRYVEVDGRILSQNACAFQGCSLSKLDTSEISRSLLEVALAGSVTSLSALSVTLSDDPELDWLRKFASLTTLLIRETQYPRLRDVAAFPAIRRIEFSFCNGVEIGGIAASATLYTVIGANLAPADRETLRLRLRVFLGAQALLTLMLFSERGRACGWRLPHELWRIVFTLL